MPKFAFSAPASPRSFVTRRSVSLLLAAALGPGLLLPATPAQAEACWFCSDEIVVHTARELVQAIGSDRTIVLEPNLYTLTPELVKELPNFKVEEGRIIVEGVENLTLRGSDLRTSKIVIEDAFSEVLSFRNCRNITLSSLELGHVPPSRTICLGAVLGFFDSSEIRLENVLLFGSGSFGIWADNSHHVTVENSVVKECSQGLLYLHDSHHFDFRRTTFVDNVGGVNLDGEISAIRFRDSRFLHNYSQPGQDYTTWLFEGARVGEVSVENSLIAYNRLDGLSPARTRPKLSNTKVEANTWAVEP